MLAKITLAGTACRSFAEASTLLGELAELAVSAKQVERVTHRLGGERVAERDAAVATFTALPLAEKFDVPAGVLPPEVAVVQVDGGRLQIRETPEPEPDTIPASASAAEWDAETVPRTGHWREDKIGLLLTLQSAVTDHDPCPVIPPSFVDLLRIPKLVRELKGHVKNPVDAVAASADEPEAADTAASEAATYEPPIVQQRQVLASRGTWPTFAPQVATAAWTQGFQGAQRQAFVADGSSNNWKLQRRFFGSFVPILDFIHALSYVFAAALAGRDFATGWACYQEWIQWVWQGEAARVIAALEERQHDLGLPAKDEPDGSPRAVVQRTLTYLRNHQDKMHYASYRQQGLPLTSSHVESVVKQINQRVKGTEKFWSEAGSEAVLQLRADYLSDGQPLESFWQRRQAAATGQRRYRRAA